MKKCKYWNSGFVLSTLALKRWNQNIYHVSIVINVYSVSQARESIRRPDVLAVLLTGRNEGFRGIVEKIIASKGLDFQGVVFKLQAPDGFWPQTLNFKLWFFNEVYRHFLYINSTRIYEDRPSHIEAFSAWLTERKKKNKNADFEIIAVAEPPKYLKFKVEIALVRGMLTAHNLKAPSLKLPLYKFVKNVIATVVTVPVAELHHIRNAFFNIPIAEIMESVSANSSRRNSHDSNSTIICEPEYPPDTSFNSSPGRLWIVTAIGRYRDEYWTVRAEAAEGYDCEKIHEIDVADIPSLYGTILYVSMSTGIVKSEIGDIGAQQWKTLAPSERWILRTNIRKECTYDIRYKRPYVSSLKYSDDDLTAGRASPMTGPTKRK